MLRGLCRGRGPREAGLPPPLQGLLPPTYKQEVWEAVPYGERAQSAFAVRSPLGMRDEHCPVVRGTPPPSAASPVLVGGSFAAGYAAAALRAFGAARAAPMVVMPPRGHLARPSSRRAKVVVQRAPQRIGGLSTPLQPTPQHLL